eukprot:scaffold665_cov341-Prasinococcus_capsulatus_cf.AAC.6
MRSTYRLRSQAQLQRVLAVTRLAFGGRCGDAEPARLMRSHVRLRTRQALQELLQGGPPGGVPRQRLPAERLHLPTQLRRLPRQRRPSTHLQHARAPPLRSAHCLPVVAVAGHLGHSQPP